MSELLFQNNEIIFKNGDGEERTSELMLCACCCLYAQDIYEPLKPLKAI